MIGAVVAISRLYAGRSSNYCFVFSKKNLQSFSHGSTYFKFNQSNLKNLFFNNWREFSSNRIVKKDTLKWSHQFRKFLPSRFNTLHYSTKTNKGSISDVVNTNPMKVNTNITNNVLLFRYERPYVFKIGLAFALLALVGCFSMVDLVYITLCRDLFRSEIDLKTRIMNHLVPIAVIVIGLIGGPAILFTVCFLTSRTVKYVVLHKGGSQVTLVTYHPVYMQRVLTLPIKDISCTAARAEKPNYVPLKIKNTRFHYVLEKSGHFLNTELFDSTVGASR